MSEKPTYEELEKRIRELERRLRIDSSTEHQKHYRKILDCSPFVIYTKDLEGRYTSINKQFENLSGFKHEDVIGKTDFDLFPPQVAENSTKNDKQVIQTGIPKEIEEYGPVDGKMHTFISTKYPLMDKAGKIYGICGVSTDITERKQAENLREKESTLLKAIVDNIPIMITRYDPAANMLYLNKAFEEKVGWTTEEARHIDLMEKVYPDPEYREQAFEYMQKASQEWKEFKVQSKSGQVIESEWSNIKLEDGTQIGIGIDITKRKKAEEELSRTKILLESSIESPKDMIILSLDLEYRYLYFNKTHEESMMEVFGSKPQIGDCIFDHMNVKEDIEKVKASYDRALAGEGHVAIEEYGEGPLRFTYEIRYNPILNETNEIIGVTAFAQNITDRKKAEEDLDQIFSMSLDMICIADINTATFIKVNPAFTEILGHSEEALLEKPFLDFVHPDDIDATRTVIEQKLQSGAKVINFENRYRCQDGSYRWLSWVSHPNIEKGVTYAVARDITESKQKEDALKKSKALLDATGRMARVGGWEVDAKTLEVTWTDETYRIHEVPLDYKPPLQEAINFFHPEDRPKLEQAIQRALNLGEPYDMEIRFITAQGKDLWTRTICQPEVVNGKTVKLKGTFQDITERKMAEEALRKSERELHLTLDATTDGIWTWNFKTNELNFSPKYYTMLGYSPDAFPANYENWVNLIHPEDREKAIAVASEYLKTKPDSYENEFRLRTQGGDYRWIHAYARVAERDEKGEAVYMIGNHKDITGHKQAEKDKDLLISRYKQKAIEMEALFNGTKLLLEEENFETTARKIFDICCNLTGARSGYVALLSDDGAENEILFLESGGLPCNVDPELPMPIRGLRAEAYKFGKAVFDNDFSNSKWMKYMPKGHVKLDNVLFAPLKDYDKTVGLIGLANKEGDFNEEDVKIVSGLAELAAIALKQSVIREALDKSEKRLLQAEKLESIGNLAGGIAHDFNNILSSIIGYTELALDDVEKGTLLEDNLQEVYTAGIRARDLIKQILTFARQVDEELKPIQVSVIARDAAKLLRSTIPTSIEIRQNIESDSLIIGDATQIHQVFMNLCTNAAQAMEEQGGLLEVGISDTTIDSHFTDHSVDLQQGDYLKIAVSDTGMGISSEVMDSIFEPYFTTKKPGEGTGMGLATVHGIVKGHGGDIKVESELGKGTVFTIYFPVTKKRGLRAEHVSEELPSGDERILLIDDEQPIVEMTKQILERQGYKVTTRASSVEALEMFKQKPNDFDLVITDMTMPNMTGDKLADELMAIKPDIPVILCTGYSKKISDEQAAEIGIKAFAYKPMVKADLAKTVRKVLDEAKS